MRRIGSNGNLGKFFSLAFAALLIAGAARAGEVVDVRVGLHPRYTRVVLQTTGEVEHSIRRSDEAELRVRVDASSQRRVLASGSGHLRSVSLEPQPDGSTIAVLSLRDSGVSYSEMSLSGPARLVIDLKRSAVAQAAPVRAAEPPPEPTRTSPPVEIEPDTDRMPTDSALRESLRDHRRTGALDSMGRDFGETAATAGGAVADRVAEGADRLGELADDASDAMSDTAGMLGDASSDALAEASDAVDAFNTTSSFREILEAADSDAGSALADGASEEIELAQNATGESPSSYGGGDSAPTYGSGAAGFDRRSEPASAAEPRKGFTGFLPAAIDHPLILGGVGVVLLLLLIVLILRGQRRSDGFDTDSPFANDEPFSLDASEVSEAVDGTMPAADVDHEGQTQPDIPLGGDPDDDLPAVVGSAGAPPPLLRKDEPAPAFGAPDDTPAPAFGAPDDTPAPAFGAPDDTPAPVAAFADDSAANSPFDASPGDSAPAFSGANAAQSEELFADERLAHLERKLKDLEEAKDRIERQLAAQSEELRVQRAAIARTQRVLRTVARTDEEATEPVPKV